METVVDYKEVIVKHLDELPQELIIEVIDFIEFLKFKRLTKTGADYESFLIQQENLRKIWDTNSEDLYEI